MRNILLYIFSSVIFFCGTMSMYLWLAEDTKLEPLWWFLSLFLNLIPANMFWAKTIKKIFDDYDMGGVH